MTKEEIIKKYEPYPDMAHVNVISVMMDEYAKQESRREAIEFTYWHRGSIAQIYMPNGDGTWDIVKPSQKPVEYEKITDDQLYDLYLLHKQNKDQ